METKKYLEIKLKLIDIFLLNIPSNIIDISYDYDNDNIDIQIILLEETKLENIYQEKLNNSFRDYTIRISTIFTTKDLFNKGKGEWYPYGYKWLSNVLFSKAEIL